MCEYLILSLLIVFVLLYVIWESYKAISSSKRILSDDAIEKLQKTIVTYPISEDELIDGCTMAAELLAYGIDIRKDMAILLEKLGKR